MAMTASLAVDSATNTAGAKNSIFTLTVSNSVAFDIPVLSVEPYIYDNGTTQSTMTASIGMVNVNPNNNVVTGSGSKTFQFEVSWHGPNVAGSAGKTSDPATIAYDVGCTVRCADGTVILPSVATVTVSPHAHN